MSLNPLRLKAARGFSLPMVLILTGVLVAATGAFLVEILGSSRAGYMILKRKQAFYIADGVSRVVGQLTQNHLNQMNPSEREALLANSGSFEQTILDLVCVAGNGSLQANACCHNTNLQDENGCCPNNMLQNFTPAMHDVQCLKVTAPTLSAAGNIPGGPFQGMQSDLVSLNIDLQVVRHITGTLPLQAGNISASSNTQQRILIGDVSPFQFSAWTYGDASLYYGPDVLLEGRTHINGDFCVGGEGIGQANGTFSPLFDQGPYLQQATVAGNVYLIGATECVSPAVFNSKLAIATTSNFTNFKELSYDSREADWAERSKSDFDTNLQDVSHGVFELQPPVNLKRANNARVMHDGYNTLAGSEEMAAERILALNNVDASLDQDRPGGLQFLTEPVYEHTLFADPPDVRRQKLAHKADLRIINGIWFVRNEPRDEETNWPGVPIWSDHPGLYTAKGPKLGSGASAIGTEFGFLPKDVEYRVGQSDLANASQLNWNSVPKRYSYYRWNPNTLTPWARIEAPDVAVTPAVLSYGTLLRTASGTSSVGTVWRPGYFPFDNAFCDKVLPMRAFDVLDATYTSQSAPSAPCEISTELYGNRELLGLLLGSRSGFQNPNTFLNSNPKLWAGGLDSGLNSRQRVSSVYPINFDVHAFQEALATTSTGELGWIVENIIPEGTFNGIVYIGQSWPGILDDFTVPNQQHPSLPPLAYEEGSTVPTTLRFPYALCGELERSLPTGGVTPRMAKCSDSSTPATNNPAHLFPNALRIINGRNLMNSHRRDVTNAAYLPALSTQAKTSTHVQKLAEGLTIATNLPVYVLGDFNRSSYPPTDEVGARVGQAWPACQDLSENGRGQNCWISTSIVGDALTLLSNDWSDEKSTLNSEPAVTGPLRGVTSPAVYNTSFLAGWNPSAEFGPNTQNNGGLNNFPRFIEMWESNTLIKQEAFIRGSLVVGFAAVHTPVAWSCCSPAFTPPKRVWRFDTRLHSPSNQPLGAPSLNIFSLSQWVRDK